MKNRTKTTILLSFIIFIAIFTNGCAKTENDSLIAQQEVSGIGITDIGSHQIDTINENGKSKPQSGCVVPFSGMVISTDTVICPKTTPYQLEDNGNGVIRISASDIKLTGYGVTLQGNGQGAAITFDHPTVNNVEISGFKIVDFNNGIESFSQLNDVLFSDMTFENPRDMPLNISEPSYEPGVGNQRITIENNIVKNSYTTGICCMQCFNSTIRNNQSYNDRKDVVESNIVLSGGAFNLIENNYIYTRNSKGCNAIWLDHSNDNTISGNVLDLGYKDGSHIRGSSRNTYKNNVFYLQSTYQGLLAVEPYFPPNEPSSEFKIISQDNVFYNNEFHNGVVLDLGTGSNYCYNGQGNTYLDGAYFESPAANMGTCPE